MPVYQKMPPKALTAERDALCSRLTEYKKLGLKLTMARGIPAPVQLDLSQPLISDITSPADCMSDGIDTRTYGCPDGLPAAKAFFAELLGVEASQVIIGGSSSLNMMYDMVVRGLCCGFSGCKPWSAQGEVKFICPVPGYDRHFTICEQLGIKMIPVAMTAEGPDIAAVSELVRDPSVKGMWNIPKYSNPSGITYSDRIVKALASLKPAAPDFRIFWDNAYFVHDIYDECDALLDIMSEAEAAGNPNMVFMFASTSKISFPGAGIACVVVGKGDLPYIKKLVAGQIICPDKINQLRHVTYLKNAENVKAHMRRHAAIIRPKFDIVLSTLERELCGTGIANWTKPRGGYFISLDVLAGTASGVIAMAADTGVVLTPAGSTWPYHNDPEDKNIRIAPTFPSEAEITHAADILCICTKIVAIDKIYTK